MYARVAHPVGTKRDVLNSKFTKNIQILMYKNENSFSQNIHLPS